MRLAAPRAVVLVIDRLGAGWLGPYGNTWLDTPNFNRLAAESVLCETAIAASPDLAASYRAYWAGRPAIDPADSGDAVSRALASHCGGRSLLITDDQCVAQLPGATAFSDCRLLAASPVTASAAEIEQTQLFRYFSAAVEALAKESEPQLLWLHSRGMGGPWDAPLELRYQFADEDDPEPPRFVDPPERHLPESFDPDELLGIVHAYAGQVALADMCLGMLLNALEASSQASETMFIVASSRGYPLGEHRRVGPCDQALYGELLHVPLLVRFPRREFALQRAQTILQPNEIHSLVREVCGSGEDSDARPSQLWQELRGEQPPAPRTAYAFAAQQRAVRTSAWFLRELQSDNGRHYELFAKPDDRWEANEVSSRCGEIVELLAAQLDAFQQMAATGQANEVPLAETLYDVWR
jgi:arylsulfatase A-like enzyme